MIFLVGGARSGKSKLALALATKRDGPVRFVATARPEDDEMAERISRHRNQRPEGWALVEEPIELARAIADARDDEVVIVDCLTLWISNLMVDHDDPVILEMIEAAVSAATHRQTIVISNEVGSGVVPMDPVARRFRDLHGWANQRFSTAAYSAYLVVAGRAIELEDTADAD